VSRFRLPRPLAVEVVVWASACVGVGFLLARGLDMNLGTVRYTWQAFWHRLPSVLALGLALQLAAHLVRWRSPAGWARAVLAPGALVELARLWLALFVMTYTYSWLKVCVPLVHHGLYDAALWKLDRWLHLGVSPTLFLAELLAGGRALPWIDAWYSLWLTSVVATQAYFLFSPERRRRANFALACAALWLAAVWIYVAVPAVGPCFFVPEAFSAELRAAMPQASALQQKLWANYLQIVGGRSGSLAQFKPFFAVAAMPSVHVGAHWLFALWARRHARPLFPWFAAATGLTLLGSVATGWHYAVDGYAGMLLAWGAARVADRFEPVAASS